MSFEPETTDIVLRQLREEIAKIREEQFVATLPTNNVASASGINSDSGVPVPAVGVTSIIPAVIRISKDTGVIDLLDFDGKNPNKDFTLNEMSIVNDEPSSVVAPSSTYPEPTSMI